ncbi:MAG TPA: hypothetical protein VF230_19010 [Acidimicrobiales bacterium]
MAAKNTLTEPFKNGEHVIATQPLRGVPEGTKGTVKMSSGLSWLRYWVEFDGGPWIGSVSQAHLVRAKDWEEFKRRREEERLRPKEPEKTADTADADSGGGDAPATGAASRVPAHLLERSKQARARLGAS